VTDKAPTPLRLGMTPWHISGDIQAQALCRQAELAEQWGYQSFWLPESHFAGAPSIPDPMLLLAAVASRTTTISLGTTSYLLPIRNPLLAAEQVAVLDQLSGGRLILGLGRGFQAGMLDAFRVNPGEKRLLFDRTLQAMLAAWSGEVVGSAEHGARMSPQPAQQPHPPIWMAAFGPKALKQTAMLGLPYLASPMESLEQLEKNYQVFHDALAEGGNKKPQDIAVMRTVFISDDAALCKKVDDRLTLMTSKLRVGHFKLEKSWIVGSAEHVAEQIHCYRRRLGVNYLIAVRPRIKGLERGLCESSMRQFASVAVD